MSSLQEKLIKSLERTIDLQEGLIADQEAEIQRLERELQTERLKLVDTWPWPKAEPWTQPYPWTVTYSSDKVEDYDINYNPFMNISEPDEKEKKAQEGTGS